MTHLDDQSALLHHCTTSQFLFLIGQDPLSSVLRHSNLVPRLVVLLGLLQLVVQFEDGLSVLFDRVTVQV